MSDKLDRLQKLPGAKAKKDLKYVKVEGLQEIMAEMKKMTALAASSNKELIKALQDISKTLTDGKSPADTQEIIAAIQTLMVKVQPTDTGPISYQVDFDRDRNGLMKSGITFAPVQSKRKH